MSMASTSYGVFHHLDDDIGRRISKGEFFDSHLRPWLDQLQCGDVVIDAGANIGFHSIYCAKRGAKVYAFEPNPAAYSKLVKNVIENEVAEKVTLSRFALFSFGCTMDLNPNWTDWAKKPNGEPDFEKTNSGGLSLVPKPFGNFAATTIDTLQLQGVTLIKVDTQGCDLQVLAGASLTLARCKPIVLFEYEDGGTGTNANGDSFQDFHHFFFSRGYELTKLYDSDCGSDYVAVPK